MSNFEIDQDIFAATSRNALARVAVFLRAGSEPPQETLLGAFEDPANVLASIGTLEKATLEAIASALRDKTIADTVEERVRGRVRAGDRRTIEAIELFARRYAAQHDYARTLAEMADAIDDAATKRHFAARWTKILASPEARSGMDFKARYAAVVLQAIEARVDGRWIAS